MVLRLVLVGLAFVAFCTRPVAATACANFDPRPASLPALHATVNLQLHKIGEKIDFIGAARPYAFVQSYVGGWPNSTEYVRLYAFRETCNCWLVLGFLQRVDATALREAHVPEPSAAKLLALVPWANMNVHYWPCPPAATQLSHVRGVLLDVALGNASGGLHVRTVSGLRFFGAGANLMIGGYGASCIDAAVRRCAQWPADARLGRSLFDVAYWTQPYDQYDDTPTEITSKIDLVRS
jgi:hypothetical protein